MSVDLLSILYYDSRMETDNYLIQLGKEIKRRRLIQNLSQEELALKCGFDRTYISMLERGKRNPSFLNLKKLCVGLEINLNDLLVNL